MRSGGFAPPTLRQRAIRTARLGTIEGYARARTRHLVSAGAARQRRARRDRARDPRPPGRDRRRGDRLGQDDAAAEDLPRTRAHPHRAHAAATDRGPHDRRAHRRRARGAARHDGRLQGALHRQGAGRHPRRAHDRRHPAQRDPPRPAAAPLRHDHRRRGPRAVAQRRLPDRVPDADPPEAPRSAGDRHQRDDRSRELREALRGCRRHTRADHRGLGAHVSGRDPLSRARRRRGRRGRRHHRRPARTRSRGSGRCAGVPAGRGGDPRRDGCRARHVREGCRSHRGAPPLRPPQRSRAAPGLRAVEPAPASGAA